MERVILEELKPLLVVFKNFVANFRLDFENLRCDPERLENLLSNLSNLIHCAHSIKKLAKALQKETRDVKCLTCTSKSAF